MSYPDVEKGATTHIEYAHDEPRAHSPQQHGEIVHEVVAASPQLRRMASPLGLGTFGLTTMLLSWINLGAHGITAPNMTMGMGFFVSGAAMFVAGILHFVDYDTYGFVLFTAFGGFWMGFGFILTPASGVIEAYGDQFGAALGLQLYIWFMFTVFMTVPTFKTNIATCATMVILDITWLLLATGNLLGNTALVKAGGATGVVTSAGAWYVCFSVIYDLSDLGWTLPLGSLNKQ